MLIVKLVSLFTTNTEYEQAKATLAEIEKTIQEINVGEKRVILVESPKDWWVIAWPYGKDLDLKPSQCKDFCICVCQRPKISSKENSNEICSENGVCKNLDRKVLTFDYNVKESESLRILLTSLLGLPGFAAYEAAKSYVNMNFNLPILIQPPILLQIEKGNDTINITLYDESFKETLNKIP